MQGISSVAQMNIIPIRFPDVWQLCSQLNIAEWSSFGLVTKLWVERL